MFNMKVWERQYMINILLGGSYLLVVYGQVVDKTSHLKAATFSSHHISFFLSYQCIVNIVLEFFSPFFSSAFGNLHELPSDHSWYAGKQYKGERGREKGRKTEEKETFLSLPLSLFFPEE